MRARLAPGACVRGDVRGRLAGPAAGNATTECMSGKFGEFSQQDSKANGEHGERGGLLIFSHFNVSHHFQIVEEEDCKSDWKK